MIILLILLLFMVILVKGVLKSFFKEYDSEEVLKEEIKNADLSDLKKALQIIDDEIKNRLRNTIETENK